MTDNPKPPAETLAPCPFCGSPDASMSYSATMQSPEPANRFVECGDCGSAGPYVKVAGDDAAAQALASTTWNSRAALTRRAGGDAIPARVVEADFPREKIARLCLSALYGFEFTGDSLCDEADRIFSRPNVRAAKAVALADAIDALLSEGRSHG